MIYFSNINWSKVQLLLYLGKISLVELYFYAMLA
jgi:hypothetical protein